MGKVVGLQLNGNGRGAVPHAKDKTIPYAQYEAAQVELKAAQDELAAAKAELDALKAGGAKPASKTAKGNKAGNGVQPPTPDATQAPEKEGGSDGGATGTTQTPPATDE